MSILEVIYEMSDNQIISISKSLEKQMNEIRKEMESLPPGTLYCARNGKSYKWFNYLDGQQKYIKKSDREFAEKLALRTMLSKQLEIVSEKKKSVDECLKKISIINEESRYLLNYNSEFRTLLASNFKPISQELKEWMESSYESNPNNPEHLTVRCVEGNYVRSKSEAMIDYVLRNYKIPFRYECMLEIGGQIIYPDFTIRHPITGKYYYWEHFGMMDDPQYVNKYCSKIRLYTKNGVIPSIQLITTYETKNNPLAFDTVEKIVKQYFVDDNAV